MKIEEYLYICNGRNTEMVVGPTEALFIIGGLLLLFGPDKIPEVAKSLGLAAKKFKEGISDTKTTLSTHQDEIVQPLSEEEKLILYAKKIGIETKNKSIDDLVQEILNSTEVSL